ncbi:MAG: secretin and TonB N-terminal domain-containing protein [Pirellulales bacterium]|nr:secretin and TonB N-terminal domain-containing protein [Pirellulales bacterium]
MKPIGRIVLLGAFAALGAALAYYLGTSPNVDRLRVRPNTGAAAGLPGNARTNIAEKHLGASRQRHAGRESKPSENGPRNLPPPPGPQLALAAPAYAQEVVPAPQGRELPNVLDFLRNGLSNQHNQRAPASMPAVPAPPRKPSSVTGGGNGTLRIRIHDEDIRKVLDLLGEQGDLNILAGKDVAGKVSATLNDVTVEEALKAILMSTGYVSRREGNIIFVGTPEDFNSIERAMDRIATRTYRPNYVAAAELQTLIAPLLTERVGVVSVSTPAESGIALDDAGAGGDKFSGGDVIVVRDYEAVLEQIDQLVVEVDVRPMQVAIEAMILSVKLQDKDNFGVNFQLLRDHPEIKFGFGSPAAALSNFKLDGGLKFGFLDSSLGAFIEALEQIGDTNVIANPRLMVLNKQRAEIQIGEKKGYISQTITETTSTQSVEFLELGAQLRLRPFISSDGLIRMEVHPELSDGDVKVDPSGITLPNKELTGVTTNIMVRDGCTVVIGGLIREQLSNTTTQVPVLGNMPVIGIAFRQTKETVERREVLVLITPRIVYEPGTCQEGGRGACEFMRRQATYADKMSIFGKRSIGRRYYRLAERAYAEGKMHKALRFAEISVQFDPLNRAALELRSDIWLNKPYEQHVAEFVPAETPLPNPLDGETMPDWLIDELENASPGPATPLHPLDPGIPGPSNDLIRPEKLK